MISRKSIQELLYMTWYNKSEVINMIMMGTDECPDCIEAKALLRKAGISYTYIDILASLGNVKDFIKIRDTHPVYEEIRQGDGSALGIPLLIEGDFYTLDPEEMIRKLKG